MKCRGLSLGENGLALNGMEVMAQMEFRFVRIVWMTWKQSQLSGWFCKKVLDFFCELMCIMKMLKTGFVFLKKV